MHTFLLAMSLGVGTCLLGAIPAQAHPDHQQSTQQSAQKQGSVDQSEHHHH